MRCTQATLTIVPRTFLIHLSIAAVEDYLVQKVGMLLEFRKHNGLLSTMRTHNVASRRDVGLELSEGSHRLSITEDLVAKATAVLAAVTKNGTVPRPFNEIVV